MEKITLSLKVCNAFSNAIIQWQKKAGRHTLPWQTKTTPYRVWVSEIMLQQTQVQTVTPYFERFMQSFPRLKSLAEAPQIAVLHLWAGLGYYARARNLHKTAQIILNDYHGKFPKTLEQITQLPGIGQSTAGAIMSISMGLRGAILDGNVRRVLCRYFGLVGWPGTSEHSKVLWALSEQLTPQENHATYNQGMMDLGATCCTRSQPKCSECPLNTRCFAYQNHQTKALPSPKPKVHKPTKQRFFMILENLKGNILLTQRPQKGLWGGLWSPPEFNTKKELLEFCQQQLNQDPAAGSFGRPIRHPFTHYTLDAHPFFIQTSLKKSSKQFSINNSKANKNGAESNKTNILWYDLETPQKVGISSLVQKIMLQMNQNKSGALK